MEVILEKFTKYFRSVLHHNQRYFLSFCVIEVLICQLMSAVCLLSTACLLSAILADTQHPARLLQLLADRLVPAVPLPLLRLAVGRLHDDEQGGEGKEETG